MIEILGRNNYFNLFCTIEEFMELKNKSLPKVLFLLLFSFVGVGCATSQIQAENTGGYGVKNELVRFEKNESEPKHIFVFYDGTDNTLGSKTNVGLIYDYLKNIEDKNIVAIYIPGVGSLMQQPVTGKLLGRGMEDRIVAGHTFLSRYYKPGDNISIFGFSRGAHQARSLAGFVSYMGLLKNDMEISQSIELSQKLVEKLKKQAEDDSMMNSWKKWKKVDAPLLSNDFNEIVGNHPIPANISFLGLWDTVPGSSIKKYGRCKEKIGSIKQNFSKLIPGVDSGHRYKVDSYPTISTYAHAVSIDENRSKFNPLLLCEPINRELSSVHEVWFPGAHSDVGGGYADTDRGLSDISLKWMLEIYNSKSPNLNLEIDTNPSAVGLAHWPIGDLSGKGSGCVDRVLTAKDESNIDDSYEFRRNKSPVPIRWYDEEQPVSKKYPLTCKDKRKKKWLLF